MTGTTPSFLALQRRQLDDQLGPEARLRALQHPDRGWISTIRGALGMTLRQLGARLRMTPQAVADLEKGERAGTITLASLRKVADALDCDVVVAMVPRTSLEKAVDEQARAKARTARRRVAQTMELEAQMAGTEPALGSDEAAAVEQWRTTFLKRLWD